MPKKTRHVKAHAHKVPFETIALLLQGGGALGAYQAGVYEALSETHLCPDWVAGISIGAVNAAIIAGNPHEARVDKLRQFWEQVTQNTVWDQFSEIKNFTNADDALRAAWNQTYAAMSSMTGIAGFFAPRFPSPWFREPGSPAATSYYDTDVLRTTLENLVDFDRINAQEMALSVGAVNVRSGNFTYFDNRTHTIAPEHIMASGALPPGFPAVEIEGEYYWDGGLVSNTPLQWVFQSENRKDTLAFQVDLWSARGDMPRNMVEVSTRQKEIMYSSRTRAATDNFRNIQHIRYSIAKLLSQLPDSLKKTPEVKHLTEFADHKMYNIVHLIYHAHDYEGDCKDYEFSHQSMQEHWKAGYEATVNSLRHPEILKRQPGHDGVFTFDITADHQKE